jgi:F420-non-reducing hydrogenase iron-sulfur subunit
MEAKPQPIGEKSQPAVADSEPRVVLFACNWCSYAGADLAGVSRLQYPSNARIVRVMCSGRLDPDFVLKAIGMGADGVLVLGCHPGDCHYLEGNYRAEKKAEMVTKLLDALGIDTRRFRLEWVSASEGQRFAGLVREFIETLKDVGKNPIQRR